MTCQPYASNRRIWSAERASSERPSMVMWLSSQIHVSLPSFWCPASSAASWLMPSIRSPSEHSAHVLWLDDLVPGAVEALREPALGEGHPHAHRDALAQRAGGALDPRRMPVLGVARRRGAPLAEGADVVLVDVVAAQMEQRVEEHGRVPRRQDEAVAIRPHGVLRVVAQVAVEEDVPERRQRHRRARVSGIGLLHRVHGQDTDCVDRQTLDVIHDTTKFTRRSFTKTTLRSVAPSRWRATFSSARARATTSASSVARATATVPRSLPLTCTA